MKIMVIGSGGREHALCWGLAQSLLVTEIVCVPGNGGTEIEKKCRNIAIEDCQHTKGLGTHDAICKLARFEQVDFAVVGPEDPLAAGLADQLWDCGVPVVGPRAQAAALEASKDIAKSFMKKYGVDCAVSETFTNADEAAAYIERHGAPIVIKADGLAAGKGVVVAQNTEEAIQAVHDFLREKKLGAAGNKIVIEDYLKGSEISILAAVSVTPALTQAGRSAIIPFVTSRDHKRLLDGARGPNTGGMGAIAPVSDVSAEQLDLFVKRILQPTLNGMIAEGYDYRGFIFFGLMLTSQGPKLLEYNVRLGDPETQAVLPLMDFDFADLCRAIIDKNQDGALERFELRWKKGYVCAPVAVSQGYPGKYPKGFPISIGPHATGKVFIAGARLSNTDDAHGKTQLVTSGGRVLAASGYGESLEEALKNAYKTLEDIRYEGMFYRRDIGLPGAAESQ